MPSTPRRRASAAVLGFELAAGIALLGAAAVGGFAFVQRPGQNRFDVWAYQLLPAHESSPLLHHIAEIGSLPALLIVIAVAIAASFWRDLARAAACALGPVVAVLLTEHIAKPLVARHAELGGFSYPSGTVTAAAAIAVVVLLASPRLLRPLAMVLGVAAIGAVSAAVIAMRWHYATDAAGGACVGMGSVFTLDALFHLPGYWRASMQARRAVRLHDEEPTQLLQRV